MKSKIQQLFLLTALIPYSAQASPLPEEPIDEIILAGFANFIIQPCKPGEKPTLQLPTEKKEHLKIKQDEKGKIKITYLDIDSNEIKLSANGQEASLTYLDKKGKRKTILFQIPTLIIKVNADPKKLKIKLNKLFQRSNSKSYPFFPTIYSKKVTVSFFTREDTQIHQLHIEKIDSQRLEIETAMGATVRCTQCSVGDMMLSGAQANKVTLAQVQAENMQIKLDRGSQVKIDDSRSKNLDLLLGRGSLLAIANEETIVSNETKIILGRGSDLHISKLKSHKLNIIGSGK